MKQLLKLSFIFILLIQATNMNLSAQKVKAVYDYKTGDLTITKEDRGLMIRFDKTKSKLPASFFDKAIDPGNIHRTLYPLGIMEGEWTNLVAKLPKNTIPEHIIYYTRDSKSTAESLVEKFSIANKIPVTFVNAVKKETEKPILQTQKPADKPATKPVEKSKEKPVTKPTSKPVKQDTLAEDTTKDVVTISESDFPDTNDSSAWKWIILLIVVLAGGAAFYIYNQKQKEKESKPKSSSGSESDNILIAVAEESDIEYTIGLNHVREQIAAYYRIDMQEVFHDTAIRYIYMSNAAIKKMYDFFKQFMENPERTNETGCYFIGCWEYDSDNNEQYNVSIEDIIEPGDDAVYGEYNLNFGKKIGIKLGTTLTAMGEKTGRQYVHTVWMHSHPGLGLFLSNNDLKVQEQLAYPDYKNRLVAIVIDTNTPNWEMVFFTPKIDGQMNNKEDVLMTHSLDTLYDWSKKNKHSLRAQNLNEEDFFKLPVQTVKKNISVFFNGKSINDIDDVIYSNSHGVVGYFDGICVENGDNYSFIIESCLSDNPGQAIGCLIMDSKSKYEDIIRKYFMLLTNYQFVIIYRSDDELWIKSIDKDVTEKELAKRNPVSFSLGQMKEWTRRRRI
jgi:hypothetical protein